MSHLKGIQKEFHISDTQLRKIMDVLDKVREVVDQGGEYPYQVFEREVLEIVHYDPLDPESARRHGHPMVQTLAVAFLKDDRYAGEIAALYKNDLRMKSAIDGWKEKKSGEVL